MDIYQIIISSMLTVVVLTGLSMMSRVRTAAAGNLLSSLAVFVGIGVTLLFNEIMSVWTIWVAVAVGAFIGTLMAGRVQMIQMPQTVALFNGLGGGASALVGILFRDAPDREADGGVLEHGFPWEKPQVLGDERRCATRFVDGFPTQEHRALRRFQKACDHVQRGRLSAA